MRADGSGVGQGDAPPRAFISYSHDDAAHCDRVLALAQQLRLHGVAVELDQFHRHELIHWPRWCEERLRPTAADFVICVCTAEYRRRIEGRVPADVGKGVFWEGTLLYNHLYDSKGNGRCLPLLLDGASVADIPEVLQGWTFYAVSGFDLKDPGGGYAGLYRHLVGKPAVVPTALGGVVELPPLPPSPRRTDFGAVMHDLHDRLRDLQSDSRATREGVDAILTGLANPGKRARGPARSHSLPPWMSPDQFIGRQAELGALCAALKAPTGGAVAVVQPQIVRGSGGVGKTRLAVQACWELFVKEVVDMAFCVSASSPEELDAGLVALADDSRLAVYGERPPPPEFTARREDVLRVLAERRGAWIILLDGADSPDARTAVSSLLKRLSGGRFVITSRRDDWPIGLVGSLPLNVLSNEDSRALLEARYWKPVRSDAERSDLEAVARQLGGLPLALVLAASYMRERSILPARYLAEWNTRHEHLLRYAVPELDNDRSLLTTFRLSYDRLSTIDQAGLHLLCWLAPEPFPRGLLDGDAEAQARLSRVLDASDEWQSTEMLGRLRAYGLIDLDDRALSLHRLVLACGRAVQETTASLEGAVAWLSRALPLQALNLDRGFYDLRQRLMPHIQEITREAQARRLVGVALSGLHARFARWKLEEGLSRQAEEPLRCALALDEARLGPNDLQVAHHLNDLAVVLRDTGRRTEAEPLFRRALGIYDEKLGLHNSSSVVVRGNLMPAFMTVEQAAEAEGQLRAAVSTALASPVAESADAGYALRNLGNLLGRRERFPEAERVLRQAIELLVAAAPGDPLSIAATKQDLAGVLRSVGRLEEARELFSQAIREKESCVGTLSPLLSAGLNGLALVMKALDRAQEAEQLLRRALDIEESAGGGDAHQGLVAALNNLGVLLQETGNLDEAERLLCRALAINERLNGPVDPSVATSLSGVAALLIRRHAFSEAEPLLRRAASIFEAQKAGFSDGAGATLNNLASALAHTGRPQEAEALYRRAIETLEKTVGARDVRVGQMLGNLAVLLVEQNQGGEAERLFRRSLGILQEQLGQEHSSIVVVATSLALVLAGAGRFAEAEPLFRNALGITERVFGREAPATFPLKANLASTLQRLGQVAEATVLLREVLAAQQGGSAVLADPELAAALNTLAVIEFDGGRMKEAGALFARALGILFKEVRAGASVSDPVAKVWRGYVQALRQMGYSYATQGRRVAKIALAAGLDRKAMERLIEEMSA